MPVVNTSTTESVHQQENTDSFPVFSIVRLGTHRSGESLRLALAHKKTFIGRRADGILGRITFAKLGTEATVHLGTVSQLTGRDHAMNDEINEAVLDLGFDLCPEEVALQVCLQETSRLNGKWINAAMKPIIDPWREKVFFRVGHENGRPCIHACERGLKEGTWDGSSLFMFVSR